MLTQARPSELVPPFTAPPIGAEGGVWASRQVPTLGRPMLEQGEVKPLPTLSSAPRAHSASAPTPPTSAHPTPPLSDHLAISHGFQLLPWPHNQDPRITSVHIGKLAHPSVVRYTCRECSIPLLSSYFFKTREASSYLLGLEVFVAEFYWGALMCWLIGDQPPRTLQQTK